MKPSRIKPISYLKAHAAEVVRALKEEREPLIIMQNGEATAVLGIREYREVFCKPYRIIYRVIGKDVYVYMIGDGRRDMQSLLARRLLSA